MTAHSFEIVCMFFIFLISLGMYKVCARAVVYGSVECLDIVYDVVTEIVQAAIYADAMANRCVVFTVDEGLPEPSDMV